MISYLDLSNQTLVQEILSLQIESFIVESQLIDYPPLALFETEEEIRDSPCKYLGYRNEDGKLVGILSYENKENEVFIEKLAVLPSDFQKGIGTQLMMYFLQMGHPEELISIETSEKNIPAMNLYKKLGFEKFGNYIMTYEGKEVMICMLEKRLH